MPPVEPRLPANRDQAPRPGNQRAYWRSLDELADTPEFREMVAREFPSQAPLLENKHSRRGFLKVMAASLSMAGLAGCRWPEEKILPFAHRPEGRIPGETTRFATAMELCGAAEGLLVDSYDGRPVKVEGNPDHPMNQGAASLFAQASLLQLYDPDRSRSFVRSEQQQRFQSSWDEFREWSRVHFVELAGRGGEGLAVLSDSTSSPTTAQLRERFRRRFPQARWFEWEPVSPDSEREGARIAFGRPCRAQLDLEQAEIIVSLDSDFLFDHPAAVLLARQFARNRRAETGEMSRLFCVESTYTLTGAMADHRYPVASSRIPELTTVLAVEVLKAMGHEAPPEAAALRSACERLAEGREVPEFVGLMARELAAHAGRCVVLAGPGQPAEVHALVHLMNFALRSAGRTVRFTDDPEPERPSHLEAIGALVREMRDGRVETLLVLGANPVYDAPADLGFGEAMATVPRCIHLGLYLDETAQACLDGGAAAPGRRRIGWHLPRAHYLESWGDARAWDGTVSVVQPLIAPLYGGKTPNEFLAAVTGDLLSGGYDLVRRTHGVASSRSGAGGGDLDTPAEVRWRQILQQGVVRGSAWSEVRRVPDPVILAPALDRFDAGAPDLSPENLEVVFRLDSTIHDGRFANSGWLQETPKALTKLTWDNAAILSPATARALGIKADDQVVVRLGDHQATMTAYILPGQAPNSVTVHLGYGRRAAGRVGDGIGFDVYPLRTTDAPYTAVGARLERGGGTYRLASTQDHHAIDTNALKEIAQRVPVLVREGNLGEYKADPEFAQHRAHHPPLVSLWDEVEFDGHRWGMAIDLTACTGCNACVVACTAENNVPVVGKERVLDGREMHWIRIDRYFTGDPDDPAVAHQPVACNHCENAPCEQVCPVAATVHDSEGLNVMVYNRCIGTRYCSNNCPYKVRRFNFFNFRKGLTGTEKMAFNPEVTVRSRGVMEKCTYCVQRIQAVKIEAKNERRPIRDGEIVPACAQTCPSEAIVFGDLSDPNSRVSRLHRHPRSYAMLAELNIQPRTQYLARLRNPSGAEVEPVHGSGGHHEG